MINWVINTLYFEKTKGHFTLYVLDRSQTRQNEKEKGRKEEEERETETDRQTDRSCIERQKFHTLTIK